MFILLYSTFRLSTAATATLLLPLGSLGWVNLLAQWVEHLYISQKILSLKPPGLE